MFAKFSIVYLLAFLAACLSVCVSASPLPIPVAAPAISLEDIGSERSIEFDAREPAFASPHHSYQREALPEPELSTDSEITPLGAREPEAEPEVDERICRYGCI